ncbi:MAG: hypothetical protein AAF192_23765 [Pseudomonadota bacterium]
MIEFDPRAPGSTADGVFHASDADGLTPTGLARGVVSEDDRAPPSVDRDAFSDVEEFDLGSRWI